MNLLRLKSSIPFSETLNKFINEFYETHKDTFVIVDNDDFVSPEISFNIHLQRFRKTGKIHIWNGSSENSIYGNSETNIKFRAWHDYTHMTNELGYTFDDESIVAKIQAAFLPIESDKKLLLADVIGQGEYFNNFGEFPIDQRRFVATYLTNRNYAINNKF